MCPAVASLLLSHSQASNEIKLAFTAAAKSGLIVVPLETTITTDKGLKEFYAYAGEPLAWCTFLHMLPAGKQAAHLVLPAVCHTRGPAEGIYYMC